jgi:DNA-directed RNA polymerase subunit N
VTLVEKNQRSLAVQERALRSKNPIDRRQKTMMAPVRCFSCGTLIGDKWEEFARRVQGGETPKTVLDDLGIKRYCCRRMILSNVEIIDEVLKYFEAK